MEIKPSSKYTNYKHFREQHSNYEQIPFKHKWLYISDPKLEIFHTRSLKYYVAMNMK